MRRFLPDAPKIDIVRRIKMSLILNGLSALSAFMAAIYWFRSARVLLPREFPLNVYSTHQNDEIAGAQIVSMGSSPQIDRLGEAMIEQSELSKKAAGWACAAAVFQGCVFIMGLIGSLCATA
jgi:hypothetical protein